MRDHAARRPTGRGVAVAVDGEVVPRGAVAAHRAARRPAGRGAPGGAGWLSFGSADRDFGSRLVIGTGGFRNLQVMGEAVAASGRRDGHAGPAPRGPVGARLDRRGAGGGRLLPAAEHRRLLHRARRRHHRPARARGVRDRLGEARGDRRRQDAAARPGRAARGRRDAGGRRLHGASLHQRRPDPGPPARGRGLRGGDAARLADRQRHGHSQPLQPAADPRAGARPGDPRRRHRHGLRRRASRWRWAAPACCSPAPSRAPRTRRRWRAAMRLAVEAGRLAHEAGRIPRRLYAEASTPMEGVPELT